MTPHTAGWDCLVVRVEESCLFELQLHVVWCCCECLLPLLCSLRALSTSLSNAVRACRERQQQLIGMSDDTERLDAWAVEFMPNGNKLSLVMADGGGNLTVFAYDKAVR